MMSSLHLIVAMAEDGAIGLDGDMPWGKGLPADLQHFKKTTMGYPIVMGRKTYESLPKRPLPGRQNIIVTRNRSYNAPGATIVHGLKEAIEQCQGEQLFLIGGGELYQQGLDLADCLHITIVHHRWEEADTFFPDIDIDLWECISEEPHPADEKNRYPYTFTTWRRRGSEQKE